MLVLHCRAGFSVAAGSRGRSPVVVQGLLTLLLRSVASRAGRFQQFVASDP